MIFNRLNGDGSGGSEDGFDAGGAWNLRGGARESEDDLAVVLSTCEVLQELC